MNSIQKWIDAGADFKTGKELYFSYAPRYRKNAAIEMQIKLFDNEFTRKKMREELAEISKIIPSTPLSATPSAEPPQAPVPADRVADPRNKHIDLPADLAQLMEGIPMMYKQRDAARYAMRTTMPGPALLELAIKAVKLDQAIRRIYKAKHYFERTGMMPPGLDSKDGADSSQVDKLVFWLRAQRKYPSQISRLKKDPDQSEKVAEMQKVMNDINEFLNNYAAEEK